MADQNMNNHVLGEDEELALDLDISAEIRFSRKDHPEGKMVPVSVDGKEEFVLIPLDIKDGDTIKVKGRGKYNPSSGKTGDLYVLVHIEEKKISRKVILIPVFVAAAIAIALFLFFSFATSCDHDWIPADCTTPKTCKICGKTSGAPLGHQWQEATYDVPRTCSVCGATDTTQTESAATETLTEIEIPHLSKGDIVHLGTYKNENNEANREKIQWEVLDVRENKVLLLSCYGLDSIKYNEQYTSVTWAESGIREWLNESFLYEAFTATERQSIDLTHVDNSASQGYTLWNTNGGEDTYDYIFLLSYGEAKKYFDVSVPGTDGPQKARIQPTEYAVKRGAYVSSEFQTVDKEYATRWWLRSPGYSQFNAAYVHSRGCLGEDKCTNADACIRPAMWIDLQKIYDGIVINHYGTGSASIKQYEEATERTEPMNNSTKNVTVMRVVNCDEWITLRAMDDVYSDELFKIPYNANVLYLSDANNEFSKIQYNGITGYVLNKYLRFDYYSDNTDEFDEFVPTTMKVTNCQDSVTLRVSASNSAAELCQVSFGKKVKVLSGSQNSFYNVEYNGFTGYIMGKYLAY